MLKIHLYSFYLVCLFSSTSVYADTVEILSAELLKNNAGHWDISVTLKHADTGWDHYADAWRIVDDRGTVLGERILYHPHVDEQPFTRGLNNLDLPKNTTIMYIEAHDKKHGWAETRLTVDLQKAQNGKLFIKR